MHVNYAYISKDQHKLWWKNTLIHTYMIVGLEIPQIFTQISFVLCSAHSSLTGGKYCKASEILCL